MPQRTEQEIMRNWKYMDPPLVSVCCITFNHEPYIRDAIEGFLMQETDFPFEVIIHDDASTDRTAEIVREYAALYPQTIKPIFQTENQYSKGSGGFGFLKTYVWPQAQGEYFALCEGDDYWIDPQKIKKQVNYMKKNRNCTFCFHNARIIIDKRLKNNRFMLNPKGASKMYNVGKMALLGFIPTASGLYARFIILNIPDWCYKSIVADYPLQLIASSYGYAYYINEPMSCYRTNVPNSATSRFLKKVQKRKLNIERDLSKF